MNIQTYAAEHRTRQHRGNFGRVINTRFDDLVAYCAMNPYMKIVAAATMIGGACEYQSGKGWVTTRANRYENIDYSYSDIGPHHNCLYVEYDNGSGEIVYIWKGRFVDNHDKRDLAWFR